MFAIYHTDIGHVHVLLLVLAATLQWSFTLLMTFLDIG